MFDYDFDPDFDFESERKTLMHFEPVTLEKQADYRKLLARCAQISSDYSFVNIWGWTEEYGLQWAWHEDLVWIRQTRPQTIYWAPVGDWETQPWAKRLFPAVFSRVPEPLEALWRQSVPDSIKTEQTRDDWDYLYESKDLADLRGNRFHKKKNLVNQFRKKYDFSYHPFGPELVQKAMAMQTDWCTWRDCESSRTLSSENRVIERILSAWGDLEGIMGGAIVSEHSLVAYTVAEELADTSVVIHFEKANQDYKGAYQAINQMFVQSLGESPRRINREQDLGDDGLRKAKLSYHPIDFIRKSRVVVSS